MQVLIVENDESWFSALTTVALLATHGHAQCVYARSLETARSAIAQITFGCIFVDLGIPFRDAELDDPEENGMILLREIHKERLNHDSPCIVLTGRGKASQANIALTELGIFYFLGKNDFNETVVVESTRKALFEAAARRARVIGETKYKLTLGLTDTHLVFAQLSGPDRFRDLIPSDPVGFKAADFARRTNRLDLLVSAKVREQTLNQWREDARAIGSELYKSLFEHQDFGKLLSAARDLPSRASDLRLCFRGTRKSLGVPFELLHDDNHYLVVDHPIFRQVTTGGVAARNVRAFSSALEYFESKDELLNILLIASDAGPGTETVDNEIASLKSLLERKLAENGIRFFINALTSTEATSRHVEERLLDRRWQIIHYAGHGRWDSDLPENTALLFRGSGGTDAMPASVFVELLKNSAALFVFLNCCFGARTSQDTDIGDFLGLMDSVVQMDVPSVISHRWRVSDGMAKDVAEAFYEDLFSNWSLEEALFNARQVGIRRSSSHRNDPGWASPILVAQSA